MADSGTGAAPDTDRCESCGHLRDVWCDDECCWWKADRFLEGLTSHIRNFRNWSL